MQVRGGSPPAPFAFTVEDGFVDGVGATLRLVHQDIEEVEEETASAVEEQIIAFKASNPGIGGRCALTTLRKSGVAVGSDFFWDVWKRIAKGGRS